MNWFLNGYRFIRQLNYDRKLQRLLQQRRDRTRKIEMQFQKRRLLDSVHLNSESDKLAEDNLADAREHYFTFLTKRVGIELVSSESIITARQIGPVAATQEVCNLLGLNYQRISQSAPRTASETVLATKYYRELQRAIKATGIHADAMLSYIHQGSPDSREAMMERFRTAVRVIKIFDNLDPDKQTEIGWLEQRSDFLYQWSELESEHLIRYYRYGLELAI